MTHCLDCQRPVRSRGCCMHHYQKRKALGTLPPGRARADVEQIALRLPVDVLAALSAEATRTGESRYRVAQRWLEERAYSSPAKGSSSGSS